MLRSWKTALAVSALAAAAVGGAAADAEAGKDLTVKRFLVGRLEDGTNKFVALGGRGTQNVYRDSVIMIVFSTQVDMSKLTPSDPYSPFNHLNDRTIKIGIPAGPGLIVQAEGKYDQYVLRQFNPSSGLFEPKKIYKNRVLFDPTKRFGDPATQNPYGFEANSLYSVIVPGLDGGDTKTVRTPEGEFLTTGFTTTFRTTAKYLQDYKQPRIEKIEANDAPGVPLEGRASVDSRADIIAFFSEPMLPAAFDPNTTFTVFISSPGSGRLVSGTIRASPDGKSFTFRPAFGYGQGPSSVRVTLSSSLSDRSGNTLDKGAVVNFTSEYDQFAPNYSEIVEPFDDENNADWLYLPAVDRASWDGWIGNPALPANNTNKNQGLLAGIFGAKTQVIDQGQNNGDGYPFWISPAFAQQLYSSGQMGGTPRTISGFQWLVYSSSYQTYANATFPGTVVKLGHNTTGSLSTNLTGSYSDTPVTVVNNVSYKPVNTDGLWYAGPTFATTWAYNGTDRSVIEISTQGSGQSLPPYWSINQTAAQGGTCRIRGTTGTGIGYSWSANIRFLYLIDKSEAQSRWYNTNQVSPAFLDPIVAQDIPPGTVVTILYQGAAENPQAPGTPDISTIGAWTTDPLNDIKGAKFIRFHVDMVSNIGSNTRPTIDEIKLPYVYF
jgi:hypothetical protein